MTVDLVTRLRGWLDEDVPIGVIMNEAAARIEQLEAALHAWNAACHIDPLMEGPRFRGVSPILAQKACLLTIAALGEKA